MPGLLYLLFWSPLDGFARLLISLRSFSSISNTKRSGPNMPSQTLWGPRRWLLWYHYPSFWKYQERWTLVRRAIEWFWGFWKVASLSSNREVWFNLSRNTACMAMNHAGPYNAIFGIVNRPIHSWDVWTVLFVLCPPWIYSYPPRKIILEGNRVSMIQVLLWLATRLAQVDWSRFGSKIRKAFNDSKFRGCETHECD
jgi:hypothetical protein